MTPAPTETAELINRLRQQLILAQVRIMELEDDRDRLAARLAEIEALLAAAQKLADTKIEEAAHAAKVLADAQSHAAQLQSQVAQAATALAATQANLTRTEAAATQASASAAAALGAAQAEITAMKASRRWRWTAWLG